MSNCSLTSIEQFREIQTVRNERLKKLIHAKKATEFVKIPKRYKDAETQTKPVTESSNDVALLYRTVKQNHESVTAYLKKLENLITQKFLSSTVDEEMPCFDIISSRPEKTNANIENKLFEQEKYDILDVPTFEILEHQKDKFTHVSAATNQPGFSRDVIRKPLKEVVLNSYTKNYTSSSSIRQPFENELSEEFLPTSTFEQEIRNARDIMSQLFPPELWPVIEDCRNRAIDRDDLVFKLFVVAFSPQELRNCNITGTKGKNKFNTTVVTWIKDYSLSIYPSPDAEKSWNSVKQGLTLRLKNYRRVFKSKVK